MALIQGEKGKKFKTEQGRFEYERKKRLSNKDEVLHRAADGTVKFTSTYWEVKGKLIRAGDRGALAAFEDEVAEYKAFMEKNPSADNLTSRSALSRMAETKVEKLLINSGYTADALAAEFGLNAEDILNPDNWKDSKFFAPNGTTYAVVFNYTGSIFQQVR